MIAAIAAIAISVSPQTATTFTHQDFLKALEAVEGVRRGHHSDGGRGLGTYAIHKGYWEDAVRAEPDLKAPGWQHCATSRLYSRLIVAAYLKHHAQKAWADGDWLFCAKVHNRGLLGASRGRGRDFAKRVVNTMEAQDEH